MLSGPGGPQARLILLVTSPRVAPGLLSWAAWEALRGAARVLSGSPDHPQLTALAEAGIGYEIVEMPPLPAEALAGTGAGGSRAGGLMAGGLTAGGLTAGGLAADGPGELGPGARAADQELARLLAAAAAEAGGPVVWLAGHGGLGRPGARERADALEAAVRELPDPPSVAVLQGSDDLPGGRLLDLVATMEVLRAECPWDARQTHESLAPHLLEEPYEALEALEKGDHAALREELGDVLLQVIFHAKVASERDDGTGYTVDEVADGIVAKLVRRHPHVFADVAVADADEVKRNWDAIKKAERAERAAPDDAPSSALDGVPFAQPALALAAQLQRRAERAGVPEELLSADAVPGQPEAPGTEAGNDAPAAANAGGIGDRLFTLVVAARAAGLDPEIELRSAARRFADRVRAWERTQPAS